VLENSKTRSHRREEADCFGLTGPNVPPPHVGGYELSSFQTRSSATGHGDHWPIQVPLTSISGTLAISSAEPGNIFAHWTEDMARIWAERARDVAILCPGYGQDLGSIYPAFSRDLARMWPGCGQDSCKTSCRIQGEQGVVHQRRTAGRQSLY
jgi:hypothetical protein